MMIYTTNILAVPLVLTIWALDIYLFLLMIYSVLTRLSGERASQLRLALNPFIEPLPGLIRGRLEHRTTKHIRQWVPWAVVVFAGLIVRHLLVLLITSLG